MMLLSFNGKIIFYILWCGVSFSFSLHLRFIRLLFAGSCVRLKFLRLQFLAHGSSIHTQVSIDFSTGLTLAHVLVLVRVWVGAHSSLIFGFGCSDFLPVERFTRLYLDVATRIGFLFPAPYHVLWH
jgi:hypothetical protein